MQLGKLRPSIPAEGWASAAHAAEALPSSPLCIEPLPAGRPAPIILYGLTKQVTRGAHTRYVRQERSGRRPRLEWGDALLLYRRPRVAVHPSPHSSLPGLCYFSVTGPRPSPSRSLPSIPSGNGG